LCPVPQLVPISEQGGGPPVELLVVEVLDDVVLELEAALLLAVVELVSPVPPVPLPPVPDEVL
jgi:hypothetical protein